MLIYPVPMSRVQTDQKVWEIQNRNKGRRCKLEKSSELPCEMIIPDTHTPEEGAWELAGLRKF